MLRDDFYCTVLAYCDTARTLAVGLGNRVYLWSEDFGVRYPTQNSDAATETYVTSLSFSSTEGGHCILAVSRNTGLLSLWSLEDEGEPRFRAQHRVPLSCVAFKPISTRKISERFGCMTSTEELLVGDESGQVFYYSLEWMSRTHVDIHGWVGSMKLLAKISIHTQQICGLAWSPSGEFFATGANDNACCLFEAGEVLKDLNLDLKVQNAQSFRFRRAFNNRSIVSSHRRSDNSINSPMQTDDLGETTLPNFMSAATVLNETDDACSRNFFVAIGAGRQKHKWIHSAAVKAIAFCPWQRGLVATGGGSNDRAIHFYHTLSGACLATINCFAQVTSLMWSKTRREIAATFGYAQPEHPYRIAVFSWPECRQVVAIPWGNEMRALLAIAYPKGPGETRHRTRLGETWYSRTAEEGCIVVACSDESVKFHEVWSGASKSTIGHAGFLGGSSILEGLEGIEGDDRFAIR